MQSSPPALTNENRVIETRKQAELVHAKMNEKLIPTFKGTLQEQMVNVNSTEIPITIYTPVDVNKTKLVIFFHGGGFTVCSRKTHQTIVNVLADATKTIWISVEYRRGPEHKFPIWWEDACEVTRHILENKESYGVESSAKVGLAGDSAGAALSASICHTLKNIDFQILVFGIFDMRRTTPSYKEFVHPMYFLTPEMLDWLTSSAFRDTNDLTDPRASVLLKPSFENLPPYLLSMKDVIPETRLIIINSIYFKIKEFSKNLTNKNADFHEANGKISKVALMHHRGKFPYAENNDLHVQIVHIPYKSENKDVEFVFTMILPNRRVQLDVVEQKLASQPDLMQKLLSRQHTRTEELHLYLLKFKMETTFELSDILQQLEMKDTFSSYQANFTAIVSEKNDRDRLYISKVNNLLIRKS
ncbi:unnamed protein product [Rotaria sordida]|uniref:Serpin domain-containing protein n=1 Tax=Rotaria sordida TaxID=392033 RepID=A0A815C0C6_9BILA|nr:unnamed protein product [Rotaria sordida]